MPLAIDGYVVGMVPIIRFTVRQLESADPRDRLSAARSLAELVRQLHADTLPAVLASVDAAAADPPAGQEEVLHHALHEAWRAAVDGSGERAHAWYAHLASGDHQRDRSAAVLTPQVDLRGEAATGTTQPVIGRFRARGSTCWSGW